MHTTYGQNYIHPTSIIEDGAVLGNDNHIGPFCYITANVVIGDGNRFEAYTSIGTPGEHKSILRYDAPGMGVIIGDNNIIREYTSIHSGVFNSTTVGNNNIIQRGAHIGHDASIGNTATLSCNTIVAGHVIVSDGVNMGLGSITHQLTKLPPYSMLGMGTIVTKTSIIEPFCIYIGSPAKFLKVNTIGIQRSELDQSTVLSILSDWEAETGLHSKVRDIYDV